MVTTKFSHAGRRALVRWVDLAHRLAPIVVALSLLASVPALVYTVRHVAINTSTTDMLSEHLPFRRNAKTLAEAFPQFTDQLSIVVEADTADRAESAAELLTARLADRPDRFHSVFYPDGHPFFRRHGLLYLEPAELQSLSNRLAEAQPLLATLNEDMSLRGLASVLRLALEAADGEVAAAVGPALARIAATVEQVADGHPARLSWRELMTGEDAASPEARRKFITVQPALDFGSLTPAAAALETVKALARELRLSADNGVSVRVTGAPAMLQEELESVRTGMGWVGLVSFLLVLGLLSMGLRSARLVLATVVTLVVGLVWTAFFATVTIGALNLISVAFAVLFIGLSVDFGIHFALRYKEEVDVGAANGEALARAAGGVGGALTLSAVAAAIGFFSFLPTSYRGVSELGLISGAGMFIALFVNLTLLPAILSLLPARRGDGLGGWALGRRLQALAEAHARRIALGALALGVAAAASLPFARFDDDPLNLRDPRSESVATLLDLLDDPRVEPYDATILAEDLDAAASLARRLEALPEVASAVTLLDLVPEAQDEKLLIIGDMAIFLTPLLLPVERAPPPSPAQRARAVAELHAALIGATGPLAPGAARLAAALARLDHAPATLETLEQALLGGLPARLDALGEALEAEPVTLAALPRDLRDRKLAADGRATVDIYPAEDLRDRGARLRFVEAVRRVAPAASGAPITITEAGSAVIRAFEEAATYALLLIGLLLLALLRDPRDAAMVLAPLVLAALLTVAATVVLGLPFNFANVIVLPLLFGLGVASGIHFVLRNRHEAGNRLMQTSTPRAVVFSALTTIGSFGALALSSHRGTASMGVLLTIAISLTMLCTLIVLPALLASASRRKGAP